MGRKERPLPKPSSSKKGKKRSKFNRTNLGVKGLQNLLVFLLDMSISLLHNLFRASILVDPQTLALAIAAAMAAIQKDKKGKTKEIPLTPQPNASNSNSSDSPDSSRSSDSTDSGSDMTESESSTSLSDDKRTLTFLRKQERRHLRVSNHIKFANLFEIIYQYPIGHIY